MHITWLGQSGYLLDDGETRLVIDPYFSDIVERKEGLRRLVPPPCSLASLSPQALCLTHDHLDHFDPETVGEIMGLFPECQLIGPASVGRHARAMGLPEQRMVSLAAGATASVGRIRLAATPARHSDPDAVGLVVDTDTAVLWFSGDTLYFPELSRLVRQTAGRAPDAAFVCINGRLGNMDLHTAARLVTELQPRVAVPMHYGMFAENTADPTEFRETCALTRRPVFVFEHGRTTTSAALLAGDSVASARPSFA